MNKTAIKNFAVWARNKLIADISYKAGLLGITEKGIKDPLPQSTSAVQFFDIGTKEPNSITGVEIEQRRKLVEEIERKAKQDKYADAYKGVIEEVAYTWFNRLIAIRFMEVNDYLPTRIRVLSSESKDKIEPDLVTYALEANLDYTPFEKDRIIQMKHENELDELFRMLFIKQCNALNEILPELFEQINDYTELLLNISFTDIDGIVYRLVNDISEDDFDIKKEGQVEIIGWLYQYYNTEPKDETFALLKKNIKITKDRIPAATQLFTPDWIVRYMVENSLGRLWLEGHPNEELKSNWKYYLDEAEQEEEVQIELNKIKEEYKKIKPEDIKIIDPAMGSGHILVYAFDVLMQIYESYGYSQRDAAKSIVENNLYGLDIDSRAHQLAYFAVMMKARQYSRKIINEDISIHVYAIEESNSIDINQLKHFGTNLNSIEKNTAILQIQELLDTFIDAKNYGSILIVNKYNWELLRKFVNDIDITGQLSMDAIGIEETKEKLYKLIDIAEIMSSKYDVVVTNPPYMGTRGMNGYMADWINEKYPDAKADVFSVFIEMCLSRTIYSGYCSMVTPESWMFITSFTKIRNIILNNYTISSLNHLGHYGFEVGFGTAAFVILKSSLQKYLGTYIRLIDKNKDLESAFLNVTRLYISQMCLHTLPGKPIAYWVNSAHVSAFRNKTISDYGKTRQGMATSDNNRFLRYWYEVDKNNIEFESMNSGSNAAKWFPYNKGGGFRKWYGTAAYVVNWENDGKEIKDYAAKLYGSYTRTIKNIGEYFKEAIAWPYITTGNRFGARYQPKGFIFDVAGSSLFTTDKYMYYLCGLLSSKLAIEFLNIINPTMNYQVGDIAKIPVIYDDDSANFVDNIVSENIGMAKIDWDSFEISWDFGKHPFINNGISLVDSYLNWNYECNLRFKTIKSNEEKLNEVFQNIYRMQNGCEIDDENITIYKSDIKTDFKTFISYAVGCMFGRYSLDVEGLAYAGGDWNSSKYSTFIPDIDNIIPITDEEYYEDDIVGLLVVFVKKVYGAQTLEENLDFIAGALGNRGNSSREIIRNYFMSDFFKDHVKTYKKRPIYWLFDSGRQNGFKALIYMHRYDENTIGNLRIDYLHKLQRIYENEIDRMQDTIENSEDGREVTAATKRKEKLIKQLQETKEYDEKIAHLALDRISIDLDDGVKVNYEKVQTDRDGNKHEVLAKI